MNELNVRDKLIELTIDGFRNCTKPHEVCSQLDLEAFADYLIAHGVTLAEDNNVLSNGDRIRAMPDEELAKEFESMASYCPPTASPSLVSCTTERCIECWLNWLKQPVKEET